MILDTRVSDFTFELDGGAACLDFANTRASSGDHLQSYADLVAFAEQSNLLNPDEAKWLREEASRDRVGAEGVLMRARRVRAALLAIFASVAGAQTPSERDLDALNLEL